MFTGKTTEKEKPKTASLSSTSSPTGGGSGSDIPKPVEGKETKISSPAKGGLPTTERVVPSPSTTSSSTSSTGTHSISAYVRYAPTPTLISSVCYALTSERDFHSDASVSLS